MIRRNIEQAVLAGLKDTPVVLLVGARQTGKSTLIQSDALRKNSRRFLSFDDTSVLAAAKADPAGFLASFPEPLALDEVQRVPELFLALKASVDRDRVPGRYLLSGSANVLVVPRVADSLAGRMEVITLWPFSQGEIEKVSEGFVDAVFAPALPRLKPMARWDERAELQQRVLRGGFPEVVARESAQRRKAWFGAFLTTILQRDVRDLSNIDDITAMPRLLSILAARMGGLLNAADLSRIAGIPQSTLKRYLSLLEAIFLFHPLPAWSDNLGKRFVKMPKVVLTDTGLAAYLLNISAERLAGDSGLLGPLLENFVCMEVLKQAAWSVTQPQIFHWRTHGQQEVDLVLEAGGRLVGIEVKASTNVTANDFKGLKAFAVENPKRLVRGIVLYGGREALPFGENLVAMPISALWRLHK
jgi:predicted AAA+ superfamily ATPase